MISKVLCLFALVALVAAQQGHHELHGHGHHDHPHAYSSQSIHRHDGPAHPVEYKDKHGHKIFDYYAAPHYEFEYKVEDKHTGDIKSQHESRKGDEVKGFYELHDPHGIRHVDYHSDKKTGFQASVKHSTHHVYHKHH